MSESLKEKIIELNQQLAPLREEKSRLNLEAKEWARRRDSLNEQVRKLRDKAHQLKERRDTLNKRVQDLKGLREEANRRSKKKHAQILEVKEEIRTITKGKPSKKREQIQTEIERLDWKIQTTPLTLEEEKGLIAQVRRLENQLSMYKKLQKLKDDLTDLRIEEKKSISEAKKYHTELLGLAEQSQELHKEMVEDLNEADALQVKADVAHQRFLEAKEKTRTIHQRIKPLREELHQIEEKNKARNKLELRKVLEERALEKLERGEKLTLEEFKALSEKGVV